MDMPFTNDLMRGICNALVLARRRRWNATSGRVSEVRAGRRPPKRARRSRSTDPMARLLTSAAAV